MDVKMERFDYRTGLKEQRELFVDCFPENIGTTVVEQHYYLWKFHSFPASRPSYEYIARIGDAMAGYYAAIPYNYNIGGRTVPVAMVCDVMTSSRFRGQGVFTKMGRYSTGEMQREGLSFATGYPIRKAVIPGHLKVGWKIAFRMPLYMRFVKMGALLRSKKAGFAAPLLNPFVGLYNAVMSGCCDKRYEIRSFGRVEDIAGYGDFIAGWSVSVRNHLVKDPGFSRWRYGAPGKEYLFFGAYKENRLCGMVSARAIVKEGVPSYGVLDFMVLPGEEACLGNLHRALLLSARENGKEAIMMMMSGTSASKYRLLRNGFFKSPFVFSLIVKNLSGEFTDGELMAEENWHLMFVDSDDL